MSEIKDLEDVKPRKPYQPEASTSIIEDSSEYEDHLNIAGAQEHWAN